MTTTTPLAELYKSPLFKNIRTDQLTTLNPFFKVKTVGEGSTVFIENMQGESLYLIEKGTIKISKMLAEGDEQVMAIFGPGDVFGEMAIFAEGNRSASARVAEKAVLFTLNRADYDKLSQLDPKLCLQLTKNIVAIFSERIRSSQQTYREMLLTSLGRKSE